MRPHLQPGNDASPMTTSEIVCAHCGVSVLRDTGHFNRAMKRGSAMFCSPACKAAAQRIPIGERLRGWTVPSGDCRLFVGGKTEGGYGLICSDGRRQLAHRVAYEIAKGPLPKGMVIDHLCRNRSCVNPEHLEAVTQRENVMRAPSSQAFLNAAKTHCASGHEFTAENTMIRQNGNRACRECQREHCRRWRRQRRAA